MERAMLERIKQILDVGGVNDAYDNLEGAISDLRIGADQVSIETIERVQKQIAQVYDILKQMGE